MNDNIKINRLGDVQQSALNMHFFDPVHIDWREDRPGDAFPGSLDGSVLTITNVKVALSMLVDATNSADAEPDHEFRDALAAISTRLCKAARAAGVATY